MELGLQISRVEEGKRGKALTGTGPRTTYLKDNRLSTMLTLASC